MTNYNDFQPFLRPFIPPLQQPPSQPFNPFFNYMAHQLTGPMLQYPFPYNPFNRMTFPPLPRSSGALIQPPAGFTFLDPWEGENVFLSPDKKNAQRLQGLWDRTIVYLNAFIAVNRPLRLKVIKCDTMGRKLVCLKFGIVSNPVHRYNFENDDTPVCTIVSEMRENSLISLVVYSGDKIIVAFVDGKEAGRLPFSHLGLPFLLLCGQISSIMILDDFMTPIPPQPAHPLTHVSDADFPPLAGSEDLTAASNGPATSSKEEDNEAATIISNGHDVASVNGKEATTPTVTDADSISSTHPDLVSQLLQLCDDPTDKPATPKKTSSNKKQSTATITLPIKGPDETVVRKKRIAHIFPDSVPDPASKQSFHLNPEVAPFTPKFPNGPDKSEEEKAASRNGSGDDGKKTGARPCSASRCNSGSPVDEEVAEADPERKWYSSICMKQAKSVITRKTAKEEADYIFSSQLRVGDNIFMKIPAGWSRAENGSLFFGLTTIPLLKLDTSKLPPHPLTLRNPEWSCEWFVTSDLCDAGHACDGLLITRTETGLRITGWKLNYDIHIFPTTESQSIVYPFIGMTGSVTRVHVSSDLKTKPLSDLHKNRLKLLFFLISFFKGMESDEAPCLNIPSHLL